MSEPGKDTGNGADGGAASQRRPSASEAELTADLKPAGALERMMIQQMARAHDTTLACFDRAEAAAQRLSFDERAAQTRARMGALGGEPAPPGRRHRPQGG